MLVLLSLVAGLLAAVAVRRRRDRSAPGMAAARGAALALIVVGGLVLAALAVVVRESRALSGIDSAVARWGHDHAAGWSTTGLKLVTDLGTTWTAITVVAVVALVDHRRTRSRWVLPFLLLVLVGDKLLTGGLKELIDRARPALNPVARTLGPSFPSGHTSTAAALWAAAALVAWRWWGRRSIAILAGLAVGIAVAVAASRVLLDVHWLTDVVAGLALGWAWFAVCAVAFGGRAGEDAGPAPSRR